VRCVVYFERRDCDKNVPAILWEYLMRQEDDVSRQSYCMAAVIYT
jgi:hypothetical protein